MLTKEVIAKIKEKDKHGKAVPFDLDYINAKGERSNIAGARLARHVKEVAKDNGRIQTPKVQSSQVKGSINIALMILTPTGELKEIRTIQIVGFNGQEVTY